MPERCWPARGVAGTLYDSKRVDKDAWRSTVSPGSSFGMALSDVGVGIKADVMIARYVARDKSEKRRKAKQAKQAPEKPQSASLRRQSTGGPAEKGTMLIWVDGRPVRIDF